MENITLAAYLEKNPESKRLKKRIARALKNYIHASKDIIHAADDLSHAKEDCSAALQAAADIIEDHRDLLEDWTNPQEESVTAIELDKEAEETASEDEDACECNGHDCGPSEEVGCHLRHAACVLTPAKGPEPTDLHSLLNRLRGKMRHPSGQHPDLMPASDQSRTDFCRQPAPSTPDGRMLVVEDQDSHDAE